MDTPCVRDAPLRIAMISPLYESVPPRLYGGTERVVSFLTEELVRMGHDVTLFATADSRTSARLVPMAPEMPAEVARKTSEKYQQALAKLTA
jgi:hypothetical protein